MTAIGKLWPALVALGAVLALAACGGGGDEQAAPADQPSSPTTASESPGDGRPDRDPGPEERDPGSREDSAEGRSESEGPSPERVASRAAVRAYTAYVEAINARDGAAICELLPPGFRTELKPPVRRASCAATIRASIGYEDPRGFPVWEETVLSGIESIDPEPERAQLTASIVTRFADRTEPSVESDIAYVEQAGGEWRLAKPSGALYRAVGKPDFPPSVISPP